MATEGNDSGGLAQEREAQPQPAAGEGEHKPRSPVDSAHRESIRVLALELLSKDMAEAAAQIDVSAEQLASQAAAQTEQIFKETARERGRLKELEIRLAAAKWRRRAEVATTVIAALLPLVLAVGVLGAPDWIFAAIVGIPIVIGICIALVVRHRVRATDSARPTGTGSSQEAESLVERLDAARSANDAARRKAVSGWLSNRINLELGEIYTPILPEISPESLAEVDDLELQVPTQARKDLEKTIARMPGGSIGIAGPRGVGKTTLIQHMAARANDGPKGEGIVVDAPVDYDGREFVLHLFAKLCEAVLGPERVAALRGWDRSFGASGVGRGGFWTWRPYPPFLGPLLFGLAAIAYFAILNDEGRVHPADLKPFALTLMALGVMLAMMTVQMNPAAVKRFLRALGPPRRADGNPVATAELRLRQIWFQQSFSTGWSGALQLPLGVSAGAEKSVQLAENQLSFPDVVSLYREFVGLLASQGRVCIGIDELDKMDDERARRFLNEIKVVFRSSNCFYLVSVSEDAMSYFERRGLPFRDVFDSSFDDVLQVDYLPFAVSHRLLRRRVVGLPVQFACLSHALGAGLPRDVIRAAREICERENGSTLGEVVGEVCARQIELKRDAARVAVRRLREPAYVLLLSRWLQELEQASAADDLLKKCAAFDAGFTRLLGPVPDDAERRPDHREALSIALEVISFCYFVTTLSEFIATLGTEAQTVGAIEGSAIEDLAVARQAFTINPGEAWASTSRFRQEHLKKEPIPPPAVPVAEAA